MKENKEWTHAEVRVDLYESIIKANAGRGFIREYMDQIIRTGMKVRKIPILKSIPRNVGK